MSRNPKPAPEKPRILSMARKVEPIYAAAPSGKSWTSVLAKAVLEEQLKKRSTQGSSTGTRPHPFDFAQAARFITSNPHHAAAIMAKKNSTTGLGFVTELDRTAREAKKKLQAGIMPTGAEPSSDTSTRRTRSKVAEKLDPLCDISFQDLTNQYGEDLAITHNSFIEVVRRGDDPVIGELTGLHHIPVHDCHVVVEQAAHDYHFEVTSIGTAGTRRFARFGDKKRFLTASAGQGLKAEDVSEVIFLRYPSSLNRWYGVPTWLSAVAAIELVQALHQHEFDFYNNRGVPEFLLFLLGKKLGDTEWEAVRSVFQAGIGLGNTHKSSAFNFADPTMKVQLEKLALEGKSDGRFSEMSEVLALEIVTGHRIPPLLAGITVAGKMGAANELPNALMAYQTLTVAPDQNTIQTILAATIGNDELNGGKLSGLEFDDFELRTIMDIMEIGQMDTISRMRQTVPEAQAEGRNPADGLKKSDDVVARLLRTKDPADLISDVLAELVRKACAA